MHSWTAFLLMPIVLILAGLGCTQAANPRVTLNGEWEARPGAADDQYGDTTAVEPGWTPVTVPSRTWPTDALNDAPAVWVRRTVTIPDDLDGRDAVLHWGRMQWGARAWVNGVEVGESPVTCPHDIVLPAGLIQPGENLIVLRVGGWTGVPKRGNAPLIPGGFPNFGARRPGAVFGDVWLDFYRAAHLAHVLLMPDVANSKVRVRVRVDDARPLSGEAVLSARVTPWQIGEVAGSELALGAAQVRVDLAQAPGPFELDVPLQGARLWSPDSPNLCVAQVELRATGELCDSASIRFGQREFRVVDGHFELNGKRFFMRGENLMWQWFWSDDWYSDAAAIKHYLVDFERGLNSKGFRTHTSPPPDAWLDIADETGMLFLSEFPMTLNYQKWPFTPGDWELYKRHALLEAEGWAREQCNRPSVIMWVPTNEFPAEGEWQNTILFDAMREIDPTRPIMRAAQDTPDIVDIHCYSGYWGGAEGDFYGIINDRARKRDPRRPLSNSEYVENWNPARQLRWNGRPGNDRDAMLVYAEFISEQTESMRRLQYDCILPYGTSGRSAEANMTTPNYHAVRSALAPVAVSIDLFNRNFPTGREALIEVCLINDTPSPQPVTVDCFITRENPEFLLNPGFAQEPMFKLSFSADVPASSVQRQRVGWPMPAQEGEYFLSAVLAAGDAKPVISQRIVHTLSSNEPARALTDGLVLVLGGDTELLAWFKRAGLRFIQPGDADAGEATCVLVWDATKVPAEQRAGAPQVLQFIREGGRLVIAAQGSWDWPQLADFSIGKARCSRAYWSEGVTPPASLDGAYLRRWNGLAGVVADGSIEGALAKTGRRLLWMEKPDVSVLTEVNLGAGKVLLTTLRLRGRLSPGTGTYDPVAERMLLHLLAG